ncbi:MAG: amino acid permease [Candidatus Berkiella sp.]
MSLKNAIGGVALLAGTAIGAAVLALPVITAHLGFMQTVLIYVICWVFMTLGALYILEVNLLVGYGTNLISMADKTLGKFGRYFTWIVYLILLYALTAAYLSGLGAWITQGVAQIDIVISTFESAVLATLFTMSVIMLGTAVTDWINRFLMIGLISAFATLLSVIFKHIDPALLLVTPDIIDIRPLPLIITAFGSAIVIPTLTEYLHGKPKQLLYVVIIGSAIPLLAYIIWESAILGIIPLHADKGLLYIQKHGHAATDVTSALKSILNNSLITLASMYFSIFALITSLLGVCLSLFDFLADGLHLPKTTKTRLLLSLITFVPPLCFIIFFPRGFTFALSFAGIFVAILLGILPAVMAWRGRYHLKEEKPIQVFGGKAMILLTIAFFLFIGAIECFNQYEALAKT